MSEIKASLDIPEFSYITVNLVGVSQCPANELESVDLVYVVGQSELDVHLDDQFGSC